MMCNRAGDFPPFATRMMSEELPEVVIRTFEHYYQQLAAGETGEIPESEIRPVEKLPYSENFAEDCALAGETALSQTILLKLNGGLGTGMGLAKAKSLLPIKEELTCLDIIALQAQQCQIPLVLMNSFSTREDSLAALEKYPQLNTKAGHDFLQHKVPKIVRDDLSPALHPADPTQEWCPPGHGDLYTALITSGMLDRLLEAGYRYAFVSNSDNLGAVIDNSILGYFAKNDLPFMMEVSQRTEADRKGGHLAQLPDGQLILRESAQCPKADEDTFQDIKRHRYFNTNNLWLNLPALKELMAANDNVLGLAMIRNNKTVDPRDRNSTGVYQLETAMGSAIAVFKGAGAILVPKTRFAPIKKTNDLLDVRSDNYVLTDNYQILANPARQLDRAFIDLDPKYYQFMDDFDARFPHGVPSLLECKKLVVRGDFKFGKNVVLKGSVILENKSTVQETIPDNTVLAE